MVKYIEPVVPIVQYKWIHCKMHEDWHEAKSVFEGFQFLDWFVSLQSNYNAWSMIMQNCTLPPFGFSVVFDWLSHDKQLFKSGDIAAR